MTEHTCPWAHCNPCPELEAEYTALIAEVDRLERAEAAVVEARNDSDRWKRIAVAARNGVVEARKAALLEAADACPDPRTDRWLRARADAQGSTDDLPQDCWPGHDR